jgi:hypothetical protein
MLLLKVEKEHLENDEIFKKHISQAKKEINKQTKI